MTLALYNWDSEIKRCVGRTRAYATAESFSDTYPTTSNGVFITDKEKTMSPVNLRNSTLCAQPTKPFSTTQTARLRFKLCHGFELYSTKVRRYLTKLETHILNAVVLGKHITYEIVQRLFEQS